MILVVVYLVASQSRVALVDVNDTVEVILEKLQRYKLDDSTQRQGVEALFRLTRISDIKARSFNIDVIATKGIATVVQASILYPEDPEIWRAFWVCSPIFLSILKLPVLLSRKRRLNGVWRALRNTSTTASRASMHILAHIGSCKC